MWVTITLAGVAIIFAVVAHLGVSGYRKLDAALKSLGSCMRVD